MNNAKILSLALDDAFDWLDRVTADLTPEQYAWQPPGTANRIDRLHAHALTALDFWVNMMGLQRPMLWGEVVQETGLPGNILKVWDTDVPIRLEDMAAYGKSLRESVVPAVEALDDAALARELDAPVFGHRDVGFVLRLAGQQMALHAGEISAAKGLQGLQGLPF